MRYLDDPLLKGCLGKSIIVIGMVHYRGVLKLASEQSTITGFRGCACSYWDNDYEGICIKLGSLLGGNVALTLQSHLGLQKIIT